MRDIIRRIEREVGVPNLSEILAAPMEKLEKEFYDVEINFEKAKTGETEYYRYLRFHVYADVSRSHGMELVDGGDTDWTQKLLNNAKERLVTSGIGSERLCEKFVPTRRSSTERPRKPIQT
jgi:hypothetical protein